MKYLIRTRELHSINCTYIIEAENEDEAYEKVQSGDEAYYDHDHDGWDDLFVEVSSVELVEDEDG